ncbi:MULTISPECIES: hypothetical protein [Streptomyces]|uniref:hypothetical protein n=1 Tax=Streptomyces TaxID=1883 RepID=UPI00331FC370
MDNGLESIRRAGLRPTHTSAVLITQPARGQEGIPTAGPGARGPMSGPRTDPLWQMQRAAQVADHHLTASAELVVPGHKAPSKWTSTDVAVRSGRDSAGTGRP